jgi:hypothetical protein
MRVFPQPRHALSPFSFFFQQEKQIACVTILDVHDLPQTEQVLRERRRRIISQYAHSTCSGLAITLEVWHRVQMALLWRATAVQRGQRPVSAETL